MRDIERFRWFSDGFIAPDPAVPNRVIDMRYSILPNEIAALWSIDVREGVGASDHVRFRFHRVDRAASLLRLWTMIFASQEPTTNRLAARQ